MIPTQEFVLLENVTGYTVDHLLDAILNGSIDAYIEMPEARKYLGLDYSEKPRTLSRYVRIMLPVEKHGKDNLKVYGGIAVLSADGETVHEIFLCPVVPITDIRVRPKDLLDQGQPDIDPISAAAKSLKACQTAERDRIVDTVMGRINEMAKGYREGGRVINHLRFIEEAGITRDNKLFQSVKEKVAALITKDYGFAGYKPLSRRPKKELQDYFLPK